MCWPPIFAACLDECTTKKAQKRERERRIIRSFTTFWEPFESSRDGASSLPSISPFSQQFRQRRMTCVESFPWKWKFLVSFFFSFKLSPPFLFISCRFVSLSLFITFPSKHHLFLLFTLFLAMTVAWWLLGLCVQLESIAQVSLRITFY